MAKSIYPETFFNIPHPTSPVVSIQLRTKVDTGKAIDNKELWEEITFDPNNFFNELTIEDGGGAPKLSLTLNDKNYTYLEDKVVKMMTAQKMSNKLVENPDPSTDDTKYFEFFVSKKKSANIRVRFGYSEWGTEDYISDTEYEGSDYKGRVESEKPVIRSPWMYFMISGLNMNITDNGLQVSIEGIDATGNLLDRAKFMPKFAKLRGTPKDIIDNIEKIIKKSSKDASENNSPEIEFRMKDEPQMYTNKDGSQNIEVMLGSKDLMRETEDGRIERREDISARQIRGLLNEICGKVSPVMYDENGNKIPVSTDGSEEGKEVDKNSKKAKETYPYTFTVIKGKEKDVVEFYYKDPRKQVKNQSKMRTYSWGEHGMSIVQDLDVSVSQMFSYLNSPMFADGGGGEKMFLVSKPDSEEKEDEAKVGQPLGSTNNASEALNSQDFESTFTLGGTDTGDEVTNDDSISPAMAAQRMMRRMTSQINESLSNGTITLQGDPFYLFDGQIQPFSFLIKLVIKRPNYMDENGEFVEGGKSYLSGLYRLKKITHSISAGSYTTSLEVMKAPFKEE